MIVIHFARMMVQVVGVSRYQKSSGAVVQSGVVKTVLIGPDISLEHGDFNRNCDEKKKTVSADYPIILSPQPPAVPRSNDVIILVYYSVISF